MAQAWIADEAGALASAAEGCPIAPRASLREHAWALARQTAGAPAAASCRLEFEEEPAVVWLGGFLYPGEGRDGLLMSLIKVARTWRPHCRLAVDTTALQPWTRRVLHQAGFRPATPAGFAFRGASPVWVDGPPIARDT